MYRVALWLALTLPLLLPAGTCACLSVHADAGDRCDCDDSGDGHGATTVRSALPAHAPSALPSIERVLPATSVFVSSSSGAIVESAECDNAAFFAPAPIWLRHCALVC